jgi:hypothetical protein
MVVETRSGPELFVELAFDPGQASRFLVGRRLLYSSSLTRWLNTKNPSEQLFYALCTEMQQSEYSILKERENLQQCKRSSMVLLGCENLRF